MAFRSANLNKTKKLLDNLFNMVSAEDPAYFELSSRWARYLTIQVSGFMEETLEEVFSEYIDRGSSERIANYAKKQIASGRKNPKTDKFSSLLGTFSPEWANQFNEFVSREGIKDALDSVMSNRHQIAHGRSVGITIVRIRGYYEKCLKLAEYVEELVNS